MMLDKAAVVVPVNLIDQGPTEPVIVYASVTEAPTEPVIVPVLLVEDEDTDEAGKTLPQ